MKNNTSALDSALAKIRRTAELATLDKLAPAPVTKYDGRTAAQQLRNAIEEKVEELRPRWNSDLIDEEWYDTETGFDYVACEILCMGDDAVSKASDKLTEKLQELIA